MGEFPASHDIPGFAHFLKHNNHNNHNTFSPFSSDLTMYGGGYPIMMGGGHPMMMGGYGMMGGHLMMSDLQMDVVVGPIGFAHAPSPPGWPLPLQLPIASAACSTSR